MIYLLHSTVAIGGKGRAGASHYLGYCEESNLGQRVHDHQTGRSDVKIIRAFLDAGASLLLVRTWPNGTRALERYLKDRGHMALHCPLCSPTREPRPWQNGQPTFQQETAPSRVHFKKPKRTNGGALSPGSPIGNAGVSPRARRPASGTSFAVALADTARRSGGKPSAATAPRGRSTGARSAGIKQPSTSPFDAGTAPERSKPRSAGRAPRQRRSGPQSTQQAKG